MKNIPILLLCFLLCVSTRSQAQKNTVASGGLATGTGGSATYSVGQVDFKWIHDVGGSASQGVQQVYLLKLNLKAYLQGYYTGGGFMNPTLANQGLSNPLTETDTLTIELHAINPPYAMMHSYQGVIKIDGSMLGVFENVSQGSMYYIVLKHRNSIETWSSLPVTMTNSVYDFTSSSSQSYADNAIEVEPGVYAMYSGDINQDGFIDSFDFPALDTDIFNGVSGVYTNTDLNGDGFVDSFDFPVFDANSYNGVSVIKPQ